MGYTMEGRNAALDGVAAAGTYIAFHTADPAGVAGANQHGSRAQTTWTDDADDTRTGSQVSVNVTAGTTITHWSVNTLATGGAMLGSWALSASETFTNAGQIQHTPTLSASG